MHIHLQPNRAWAVSASILPSYHPLGPRAVPHLPKVFVSRLIIWPIHYQIPTWATHSAEATMHAHRMFLKTPTDVLLTYQPSQPRNHPARHTTWNSRWRIAKSQPLTFLSPFCFMGSFCSVSKCLYHTQIVSSSIADLLEGLSPPSSPQLAPSSRHGEPQTRTCITRGVAGLQ